MARRCPRLSPADPGFDFARYDPAFACLIHDAQVAAAERERNGPLFAPVEMKALESAQGADWRPGDSGMRQVKLYDFIRSERACVFDLNGKSHGIVRRDLAVIYFRFRIREGRVAQAVAEWIEGFALKIAVGAARHRVVLERGKLVHRLVKGDGKPPGGAEVARKCLRDRRAALAPRIPSFEDGWNIFVRPIDRESAAVEQDKHGGLPHGDNTLEQLLLRRRQINPGAVAAGKALDLNLHFLTFDRWGETENHHDKIRIPRGFARILHRVSRRRPEKARLRASGRLEIFDLERVGMPFFEVKGLCACGAGMPAPILEKQSAVQPNAIAVIPREVNLIFAVVRRNEHAGPANGEISGQNLSTARLFPHEVHFRVDASQN